MNNHVLRTKGTPGEIGQTCGKAYRALIEQNLNLFVRCEETRKLMENPGAKAWAGEQRALVSRDFPWLAEEIGGIAQGAEASLDDIWLLNLRVWQYREYHSGAVSGCTSLAVRTREGALCCAGALDDPEYIYCGAVVRPAAEGRYGSIGFPLAGTVWAARGINQAGLSISSSSQLICGLHPQKPELNQDIALRVMLDTCATVEQARALCEEYAFTINLVATDGQGGLLAGHQTPIGFFDIPCADDRVAVTNHVVDDMVCQALDNAGGELLETEPNTRYRRGALLRFLRENPIPTCQEVWGQIAGKAEGRRSAVNNSHTYVLTLSDDSRPGVLDVMYPCYGETEYVSVKLDEAK